MIRFLNKIHYGLFHFQLAVDSKENNSEEKGTGCSSKNK